MKRFFASLALLVAAILLAYAWGVGAWTAWVVSTVAYFAGIVLAHGEPL